MKEKYKKLMDGVYPSDELIERTKYRMQNEVIQERCSAITVIKRAAMGFAAGVILFAVSVNAMPALAATLTEIPVIGDIVQVLTISSYLQNNDSTKIQVSIPGLVAEDEERQSSLADVNLLIKSAVDEFVKEANLRVEEYKQAAIDTGETEEEFAKRDVQVDVDYKVMYQSSELISFIVWGSGSWSNSEKTIACYNIDLRTGDQLSLDDILGEGCKEKVNNKINQEIINREQNGEAYFNADEGGFVSIDENVKWYIAPNGNPVAVFEKYSIAPGSTGICAFEIPK